MLNFKSLVLGAFGPELDKTIKVKVLAFAIVGNKVKILGDPAGARR